MRFPPSFIERLRSHFLMSEVIGKRMPLKKHGREYQGLCPFHNEKTPSFTVNDEKGFYHCFGCAAHGDAISFVMKFDRLKYPEALELLARDAGIPLPKPTEEEFRKSESDKTLFDVLEAATKWFEQQLSSTSGMVAKDYIEKRGLKPETIRTFRIGYAPDERTGLYNYLLKAGFSQALQAEAGLIILSEQGAPYDRFRGRVMFPIRNSSGKVIAFGGRLLGNSTNKALPKYLNSPETPVFKKGEILYNLDLAKKAARDDNFVVVMEGYMDVVSSWQSGIPYAVATLGTAVTPDHLRLLWQLAKEPVICLDGDAAGERALWRAVEIALPLLKPGFSLRFAELPDKDDPDTYVQKHGSANFKKLLKTQPPLHQQIWARLIKLYAKNFESPEGRAKLEEICKQLSGKIGDSSVQKYYKNHFINELWSAIKEKNIKHVKVERSKEVEQMVLQHHTAGMEALVQRMLTVLIKFPELMHKSQVEETLAHLDIRSPYFNTVRNVLVAAASHVDIDDREAFMGYLHKQLHGQFPEPMKLPYKESLNAHDALVLWGETVSVYEVARLEFELKELQESVGQAMDDASYTRLLELQQAIQKAKSVRTFAPAEVDEV